MNLYLTHIWIESDRTTSHDTSMTCDPFVVNEYFLTYNTTINNIYTNTHTHTNTRQHTTNTPGTHRKDAIEIKNLFSKSVLAKAGSSSQRHNVSDRPALRGNMAASR